MTYYNTNDETGQALKLSIERAATQEEKVLEYFKANPGQLFATHEIRLNLFYDMVPITSVQRAITNLTNEGELEKLDDYTTGPYGKQVHRWRLAQPDDVGQVQRQLF